MEDYNIYLSFIEKTKDLVEKNTTEIDKSSFEVCKMVFSFLESLNCKYHNVLKSTRFGDIISMQVSFVLKILLSEVLLIGHHHAAGTLILLRVIVENIISCKFLIEKDDEGLYAIFRNNSLVNERLYMEELDKIEKEGFDYPNFMEGTRKSIKKTKDFFGIDPQRLSKRQNQIPSVEDMAVFLVSKGALNPYSYSILYRGLSSYVHGSFNALEKESRYDGLGYVDSRVINPLSILLMDFLFYVYQKKGIQFIEEEDRILFSFFDLVNKLDKKFMQTINCR